jgi:hypothetical protein
MIASLWASFLALNIRSLARWPMFFRALSISFEVLYMSVFPAHTVGVVGAGEAHTLASSSGDAVARSSRAAPAASR